MSTPGDHQNISEDKNLADKLYNNNKKLISDLVPFVSVAQAGMT